MKKIILLLLLLPFFGFSQVVDLAKWTGLTPEGWNLSNAPTLSNQNMNVSISGSNFELKWDGFDNTGWTTDTQASSDKYIQMSISPKNGYTINLSQVRFAYNKVDDANGCKKFLVKYSRTGNFPQSDPFLLTETTVQSGNNNVSLNFPANTTINSGETIYVRIYAYNRTVNGWPQVPFRLRHKANDNSNETYYFPTFRGTISASAPACTVSGNQTAFGTDKWIGYVYNNASDVTNPPANAFNSSNYKGYININTDTFDNDLGTNSISGPNVCGSYADFFAVRYKMKKTFPAGTYVFKVGGDDGYRLSVNGVNVIDKFVLQSYGTTESAPVTLSGATELILEYYEDQTFSRVSFNYTYTPCVALTAPTGIVKSATTVCTTGDSVLLTAQGGTPAGTAYQWGTGAVAGTNPIANENGASITVSPTATTTYWVRRFSNDACSTYSSITTIAVTPTDRNVSGNGEWIGYVYSNYTNNATTPAVNDANYRGYVTENAIFDREVVSGSPFRGRETYLCNAPTERYFVRYKMTLNLVAGKYNFTVGGDDGYRLTIDGTAVTAINNWNEHGYTTSSVSQNIAAGTHTFILEYYNGPSVAHVSFNYNKVEGDPTEFGNNVWNVYGYNEENINIDALSASYAGYYTDPAIGISSQDRWASTASPSVAVAVPATGATGWIGGPVRNDNFTLVHKRKGFPCGMYELKMEQLDDQARVFLDGVQIFDQTAASNNLNAVIGTYKLNADSKIEVRLREGGGNAYLKLAITDKPAVYNNGSWSTTPANTNITINSDLALNENLNVCSCTVKPGKKLTILANATLNVEENVKVEATGSILVKNTGSLVQMKDDATFTGDANSFTMERNTTPMINYDFSYWGSPVAAQNLKTFSPNTLADKYYSFNGASWVIENPVTTSMTAGRGYIVRAPQGWANTITNGGVSSYNTTQPNGTFEGGVFQGVFTGKANAGTITVPLMGNVGVNNLIGNPYASPISVDEFIKGNTGKIDGTFYFWTHKTRVSSTPNQNGTYSYNNQDYAVYNKTGGVATSPIERKPDGIIASGQGFFVRTIGTGNVVFKNSMRVSGINKNKDFYRTGETTDDNKNRFWLSMGNADGLYSEFLVGYNEEATNDFDVDFDGITTSTGNVMLYTTVNANKLAIQGRQAPFAQSDVVPVGYKAAAAGQYTISINKKEGLFERNQAIYLYDYVTNEHHDLTAGDFTFTSAAGTFDTRFEVRFADRTLGVETPVASNSDVIVYKNGNQIAAKVTNFTIEDMQVYDITGKILFSKKGINSNEFSTASLNVANQVVVVKVTLDGGQTISRKVIMN